MLTFEEALKNLPGMISVEAENTPEAFASSCQIYKICYQSDDCKVMGYAAAPKTFEAPLPCIVYNRGGNREFGFLRPESVCRFAEKGFIVLGSQYRGNLGGTGVEEFGGADVNDVIKLIDMGLACPLTKNGGVYMVGHSRGGMMTYLACARDSRVKAAAVGAGMADCFIMYERREQEMKEVFHELVGGGPSEKREAFIARSATYWPEKIIPPVLVCQGTNDWRVDPEQSYKMYEGLKAAGKECKLITYEGIDHSLMGSSWVTDAVEWLLQHPIAD